MGKEGYTLHNKNISHIHKIQNMPTVTDIRNKT